MTSYRSVRAEVQSRWGHRTGPGAGHCPCRFAQLPQLDSSGPWAWAGLGPTRQLALGADCVPSCPFSWQVQRGRGPHLEHTQLHQHLRVCGRAAERARGRDAGHDVSAHGRWAGRSEPNPRRAVAEGTPGPAAVGGFSTAPRLPAHPPHSHPHLHTCLPQGQAGGICPVYPQGRQVPPSLPMGAPQAIPPSLAGDLEIRRLQPHAAMKLKDACSLEGKLCPT